MLEAMLKINKSNIWTKGTIKSGFMIYDKRNGRFMQKHGNPTIHDDQAQKLLSLLSDLNARKKSMTSGLRCPGWLRRLLSMVDLTIEGSGDEMDETAEPLVSASPLTIERPLVSSPRSSPNNKKKRAKKQ